MTAGETFEIFDSAGNRLGLAPREAVHRLGYWHRAAHVWLFDAAGRTLLQRRAPDKDIAAGRWDFSVGEHLKPGEGFLEAALRGLREELGVREVPLAPLGPPRRFGYELADPPVRDYEETRSFRGRCEGTIAMPDGEVDAVRWMDLAALAAWVSRAPEDFTPWFLPDARAAGLLG